MVAGWSRIRDQDLSRDHRRDHIKRPMSGPELIMWVIIAAVVVVPAYGFACWFWPFTSCSRCKGGGRRRSPSGRNWRPCRRCKGSGSRVRTGRRIWNWFAGQKDAAR